MIPLDVKNNNRVPPNKNRPPSRRGSDKIAQRQSDSAQPWSDALGRQAHHTHPMFGSRRVRGDIAVGVFVGCVEPGGKLRWRQRKNSPPPGEDAPCGRVDVAQASCRLGTCSFGERAVSLDWRAGLG
jgi:hypothetical protein